MKKNYFSALLLLALILFPGSVRAHERQVFDIAGIKYLFVVGSIGEPVFVDQKSGVELRVKLADPLKPGDSASPKAKPFAGLESTLKVEVSAGGVKREFSLAPVHGEVGAYKADFYPTVGTTYSYRFFGTVNSAPVDFVFTCNPAGHPKSADDTSVLEISSGVKRILKAGSFGCPQDATTVQFPEKGGSMVWFKSSVNRIHWVAGIALLLSLVNLGWSYRLSKKTIV